MARHVPAHDSPGRPRRAGVTLVELLVIMTIVGISLAVVMPRMRQSERSKVDLAAMQLMHDMDLARTRALATRSLVRVAFSTVDNSYAGYLDANRDGVIGETAAEREALAGGGRRLLPDGVQFGRGNAPVLRSGDGVLPPEGRTQFTNRGLAMVSAQTTYNPAVDLVGMVPAHVYLRSSSDASAVAAIVVLPSGLLRLRRYRNGEWE
jgi:type II secretory pathway pseudopilin PulG